MQAKILACALIVSFPIPAWADSCLQEVADVWVMIAEVEAMRDRQEEIAIRSADQELYDALKEVGPFQVEQWRDYAAALSQFCERTSD